MPKEKPPKTPEERRAEFEAWKRDLERRAEEAAAKSRREGAAGTEPARKPEPRREEVVRTLEKYQPGITDIGSFQKWNLSEGAKRIIKEMEREGWELERITDKTIPAEELEGNEKMEYALKRLDGKLAVFTRPKSDFGRRIQQLEQEGYALVEKRSGPLDYSEPGTKILVIDGEYYIFKKKGAQNKTPDNPEEPAY